MRVQLMSNPDKSREEGAVAVIVALLLTVLLGISAFAVDFGLAYSYKRQLQTGIDGAVIAAASTYADQNGSCGTLMGSAALQTVAYNRADDLVKDADPTATLALADFDVRCSSTGGVEVEATAKTTTEVGLGGAFGLGLDEVNMSRSATASLEVAGGVSDGLRPIFMCSADLPPVGETFPTKVRKILAVETGGPARTGCPEPSGNWWNVDCPENEGSNNGPNYRATIRNGCAWPLKAVENPRPAPPSPDGLLSACGPDPDPLIPDDCMGGHPGNINNQDAVAWRDVMDAGDTVILPVFCGGLDCSGGAIDGTGDGAVYPVWTFVAMRVCGFHFGGEPDQVTTGTCGNNPDGLDAEDPRGRRRNQTNYMLASFERVQVTGTVSPSGCSLGAACDGGVRQVFMTD